MALLTNGRESETGMIVKIVGPWRAGNGHG